MNLVIAQVVKLIVDFIKNFFAKAKTERLNKDLNQKQENSNELKKTSDFNYATFSAEYNKWLDSEERQLRRTVDPVQVNTGQSSKEPAGTTSNDRRPAGNDTSPKRSDSRPGSNGKRRKKRRNNR